MTQNTIASLGDAGLLLALVGWPTSSARRSPARAARTSGSSARRSTASYASTGLIAFSSAVMWFAHPVERLLDQVRAAPLGRLDAVVLQAHVVLGRPRRLDRLVGAPARRVLVAGDLHQPRAAQRAHPVRSGDPLRRHRLLPVPHHLREAPLRRLPHRSAEDGQGAQPAPAEPVHGDASAVAVPRVRVGDGAVRLRPGGAHHRQPRRLVAAVDAPLDDRELVLPVAGPHPRHAVGLRGARLGRLLGLGSRRERGLPAVADGDGVPALDDDPGTARHDEGVERLPRHHDVPPDDVRHLHDPLGHRPVGARVRSGHDAGVALLHVHPGHRRLRVRLRHLPPAASALAQRARLVAVARVRLPPQQLDPPRRGAVHPDGDDVPDAVGVDRARPHHRRAAVLQQDDGAGRPGAPVPDRRRSAHRLAQGVGGELEDAVRPADGGDGADGCSCSARSRRCAAGRSGRSAA